jgi:hypothetical protein
MKNVKKLTVVLFSILLFGFISCTNEEYDFSKISGKVELYENSVSIPIGFTTITLDSLIRQNIPGTANLEVKDGFYIFTYSGDLNLPGLENKFDSYQIGTIKQKKQTIPLFDLSGKPAPYNVPQGSYNFDGEVSIDIPSLDTSFIDVDSLTLKNTFIRMFFNTRNLVWNNNNSSAVIEVTPIGNNAEYYINDQRVNTWTINKGETKLIEIRKITDNEAGNTLSFKRTIKINIINEGDLSAVSTVPTYLDLSLDFPEGINSKIAWGKVNYYIDGNLDPLNLEFIKKMNEYQSKFAIYNPKVKIKTSSNIGVPFDFILDVKSENSATGTKLMLQNTIYKLTPPLIPGTVKENEFLITRENGTSDLFNNRPDKFIINYKFQKVNNSSIPDYITDENKFHLDWLIEIPLQFANGTYLNLFKYIDNPLYGDDEFDNQEDMSASLNIDVDNRLPIKISINIYALDKDSITLFETHSDQIEAASPINPENGFALAAKNTKTSFPLDASKIELLSTTKIFKFSFQILPDSTNEFVTIQPSDYISVKMSLKLKDGVIFDLENNNNNNNN